MNYPFVLIVASMLALALGFVLPPLLRQRRGHGTDAATAAKHRALRQALDAGVISADEFASKRAQIDSAASTTEASAPQRSRSAFAAALAVVLLLPLAAIGMYLAFGNPAALDPASASKATAMTGDEHGPDMQKAIEGLQAKLKQNPDDVEGWMLLGRAYKSTERFQDARDALKQAYDRAAGNPDVQVEYAEALALASDNRRIDGEALQLLQKAIKSEPQHQRALWLLGIADYQAERYADAIQRWEALRDQIPADAAARTSIQNQIDEARSRAGMPPDPKAAAPATAASTPASPAATATTPAATTSASDVKLTLKVSLDPKLASRANPDSIVFIFAKAAGGPPMPLAVQRLKVSELPATVTLDDSKGMMPTLKLSQFPQVIVGARISASGNASAQSGDLQTVSAPLDVNSKQAIDLRIDQVVP